MKGDVLHFITYCKLEWGNPFQNYEGYNYYTEAFSDSNLHNFRLDYLMLMY